MTTFRTQWDNEGYIVARNLFDQARVSRLREVCDGILAQFLGADAQSGKPGNPDGYNMRHLNHPAYFKEHPEWFPALMDTAAAPRILQIAAEILGEDALFRCTTYWFNPRRVSQDGNWHRDSQFVTKSEAEEKQMLAERPRAVQLMLALAPTEDNEYVPGSHLRWDTPEEYQIRKADGQQHNRANTMPGAIRVRQEPGDMMAFNPSGLHRGRYHADKLRRTLMLTYTGASYIVKDYFSAQPWFLEAGYLAGLAPQTSAFFERFCAVYADFWRSAS